MKLLSWFSRPIARPISWLLSVPLFFKIMGIGLVVGAVFGGIMLLQIRGSVSRTLYQMLEERTRSIARSLVVSLKRPLSTGDLLSVNQQLQYTQEVFPDIRYIIVRDTHGRVVSHTFGRAVPHDLPGQNRQSSGEKSSGEKSSNGEPRFQVLASRDGLVFDVTHPILEGHAGVLQIGLTDETVTQELTTVTRSVLWCLALCATIGAGLALLLTHILTRPIHLLVEATNRIRSGDFETRAEVFSADEIGRLAVAFNQMTEGLYRYRRQVEEKERARLALVEKTVQAQEDERKNISRELHDQLGQSLLALLLVVQSLCKENVVPAHVCRDIEIRIQLLIEEVRRLAWGMRPSILDDYGLDFALARHAEEMSNHSDLTIDYQYTSSPGSGRLPSRVEVTLYRIAQEAIANIVRHASATRVSAVVLQQSNEVTLLVEDNGRGFEVDSVRSNGADCLGLTSMVERANLLGGTCAVESVAEQGTTIRARIPLSGNEECQSES